MSIDVRDFLIFIMNKIFEKIYKDYKKSNKTRRVKLLKKYNCNTEEEFLSYLKEGIDISIETNPLDIVIAFDLTDSMSRYRDEVRKVSKGFVEQLFDKIPNLNMEIIGFGDYCDGDSGFQSSGLTSDKGDLVHFINTCKDTSGGDTDEFYEYVIQQVVRHTKWRKGSDRVFVLLGDAKPHGVGYRYNSHTYNISWMDEVQEAINRNINIHTVYVDTGLMAQGFYSNVASMTGGAFLEFKHVDKLPAILQGIAYSKGNVEELKSQYTKAIIEDDFVMEGYYKTIIETI